MAKKKLPVNYKDDVMSSAMGAKRRWQITQNTDGTYNIEDVTTYDQVGSEFGAGDINATNQAVNESFDKNKMISDMDELDAVTQSGYGVDALLVKDVNDSLQNVFKGIDTTKIVQSLIKSGTYTATEDCYAIGRNRSIENANVGVVYIDGVEISATSMTSSVPLFIPMKKGQTISFGNKFGGQVTFYGIK